MNSKINRRKFVTNTAASAAALMMSNKLMGFTPEGEAANPSFAARKKEAPMEMVLKYRKIDAHAHVGLFGLPISYSLDFADRLGIDKLIVSKPMTRGEGPPDEFRACNDFVMNAVKQHPDRFIGEMTLNPRYKKEALEEIDRCTDQGMVGLKLYTQVKINDPLFYPIIEKFIDLKMIILMHAGIGHARIKFNPNEPPNVSIPEYFVDIAQRYPEAMFQFAHIGGGVDWEDACKALQHSPNVYVDVSGSNNVANMIDFAMRYIGEDRLLFGCDNSFYQGVGHLFSAKLTDGQRKKIFFDNYNNILRKAGRHVD